MIVSQPAILGAVPLSGRALRFQLLPNAVLDGLVAMLDAQRLDDEVVGLGVALVAALSGEVSGLRTFPAQTGPGIVVPSTPAALWIFLRGTDRGELVMRTRAWCGRLAGALVFERATDVFRYAEGRDLTGYVDGTENPVGPKAEAAAFVGDGQPGLSGSSFVAVQQWQHDLSGFATRSELERDHAVGRSHSDNGELEDAPPTAHVKRTAQESFEPPAFLLRRSMPYADHSGEGLLFIAYGRSFDAFEAQLRRMLGAEDGIVDALFSFSQPLDGAYYWCPPLSDGRLDLRALAKSDARSAAD